MKLEKEDKISAGVAEKRALEFLQKRDINNFASPGQVADAIWPGHKMNSQGAGAAANAILKRMEKRCAVEYHGTGTNRGWRIGQVGKIEFEMGRIRIPSRR